MTLLQMYYVLAVAKAGSMNKAAEQLYVTQPTLTRALHEVEAEIGITIFMRSSRGVVLTSEGEEFLHYVRQVYQQYELLEKEFIDKRDKKRKFAISTQHYSFVIKAFIETVKQYDTTKFEFAIRETRTADVIRDVREQRSAIGVLFRNRHNKRILSNFLAENALEFHKLIECNACVFLWKGHPLSKEVAVTMQQLEPYPCLAFDQGNESSSYFSEEILHEKNYPHLIKVTDRASMQNLLIGLNGYTLCSGIFCEEINGPDFISVPFREDQKNPNLQMEIGYIRRTGMIEDEIEETFLHEIKKTLET